MTSLYGIKIKEKILKCHNLPNGWVDTKENILIDSGVFIVVLKKHGASLPRQLTRMSVEDLEAAGLKDDDGIYRKIVGKTKFKRCFTPEKFIIFLEFYKELLDGLFIYPIDEIIEELKRKKVIEIVINSGSRQNSSVIKGRKTAEEKQKFLEV